MAMTAAGVPKLIEECGELIQVLGKKLAMWDQDEHWDGTGLQVRIQNEMGDVLAAIEFVIDQLGLSHAHINVRAGQKLSLYNKWHAESDNNDHGIDAVTTLQGDHP